MRPADLDSATQRAFFVHGSNGSIQTVAVDDDGYGQLAGSLGDRDNVDVVA